MMWDREASVQRKWDLHTQWDYTLKCRGEEVDIMPCSAAVSVDYRSDSSTMPVARGFFDPDYSRFGNYCSNSYVRRTSNSASSSDVLSKYPTSRTGLTSRSSSLTEDLRDRSQTRDSGISRGVSSSRSRTSSYSSTPDPIFKPSYSSRKSNYTCHDVNEFLSTYSPDNYIVGTHSRAVSDSGRPPTSSSSLSLARLRPALSSKDKQSTTESANLEVITPLASQIINGGESSKDRNSRGSLGTEISSTADNDDSTEDSKSTIVRQHFYVVLALVFAINFENYRTCSASSHCVEAIEKYCKTFGLRQQCSYSSMTSVYGVRIRREFVPPSLEEFEFSDSEKDQPPSGNTNNGLSGLRNIGNTCFLNSVVQCLSNTRLLREYLLNREYISEIRASDDRGSLIRSFGDVVTELWSDEGKLTNTAAFKSQIQRYAPRFMGYNQQDAQEFLRYLLEGLHDDVNRVAIKPKNLPEIDDDLGESQKATEAWKQYLRIDNSRIVDLFVGQLKSTLLCTICHHASTTFEAFWDLSLPLPNSHSGSTTRLSQCLDHFTKEEVLDGHEMPTCSKCKTRRKCTKRFSIQKFPKILVLHLKRFSPSERYRKLSATVEFPLTNLDMSAYSSTKQACTYNLYAVSNHSGTAYSGHYTAYCLHSGTGHWYEFNDSRVTSISPRNVVSSEAYLLFYEQVPSSVGASRL